MLAASGVGERFREVIQGRHEYAKDWMARTGRNVFGYFCTYTPEEVIHAAGVLPVRIYGGCSAQETGLADEHIHPKWCLLSRERLVQGLLGRYDYLDGIVQSHSCVHVLQTFLAWKTHIPRPLMYHLYVPHLVDSVGAVDAMGEELQRLMLALEERFGGTLPVESLDRSIHVYNTNRRLMRRVYELRKRPNPPVSGIEALEMVLASTLMDKQEHSALLERWLEELARGSASENEGPRLMVIGSELEDVEFVKLVESLGACVVIDEHCTGSRAFFGEIEPREDRFAAIATRYLKGRIPCPVKDLGERQRLKALLALAKEYDVEGVIYLVRKWCDPFNWELIPVQRLFSEAGIPFLHLEIEGPMQGQVRTRVEAFIEMLQV